MSKEQTPIGYLFNGRFYKTIEDLRGKTMSEDNHPQPLFTENQCNAKVLEALERELQKIVIEISMGNEDLVSHYNGDFRDFKEYFKTEVKPRYK